MKRDTFSEGYSYTIIFENLEEIAEFGYHAPNEKMIIPTNAEKMSEEAERKVIQLAKEHIEKKDNNWDSFYILEERSREWNYPDVINEMYQKRKEEED